MRSWYLINVTLHVLAALIWLGGMFFLGLVGAPVLRGVEPASLRQKLFHDLGLRFRAIGWICIAILLATGVVNLAFRGWLRWDGVFGSADFWRSAAGTAFPWASCGASWSRRPPWSRNGLRTPPSCWPTRPRTRCSA